MSEFVPATIQLYRQALLATWRSLTGNWVLVPAVMILAVFMYVVTGVAMAFGMLGGLLLGVANAFVVGVFLGLLEQAVVGARPMVWRDLWDVAGSYFWDVITVGFIVWMPLQILELGMQANPYGPAIVSAVFLLLFILLNPVPELIYQGRSGASLEILKDSYEFVLENWIEWFLPLAVVFAPFGLSFFFSISSRSGRLIGLDFFQLLGLPFAVLSQWFQYLGLSSSTAMILVLCLTPVGAVLMMLFRGHLYKALTGSSRRQRLFQRRQSLGT